MSLEDKLKALEKSPAFQKKIAEARKAAIKAGKSFGSGGGAGGIVADEAASRKVVDEILAKVDAVIVANNIARQLEGRIAYRRAVKMAIASTMRMGAEGIKIQISGRLNGAEMARSEMYKEGRTPLHTFRADIDYALAEALTKVGLLGVKVWICRGEVYGKADLTPNFTADNKGNNRGNGRSNRGGNRKKNNNR